eukprot:TRINITY_DN2675_c0_g2_i2.p1 TRINITY_DN2675_c0_g2~~TRINITY_DN2675_c0_g2_i2.p1  ORF type:complete len:198 (+),score=62.26 TRINITY_DN2675_c0_g2_i2:219-812(+)
MIAECIAEELTSLVAAGAGPAKHAGGVLGLFDAAFACDFPIADYALRLLCDAPYDEDDLDTDANDHPHAVGTLALVLLTRVLRRHHLPYTALNAHRLWVAALLVAARFQGCNLQEAAVELCNRGGVAEAELSRLTLAFAYALGADVVVTGDDVARFCAAHYHAAHHVPDDDAVVAAAAAAASAVNCDAERQAALVME